MQAQLQSQFKNMLSRNFAESLYSNNPQSNYDFNPQQSSSMVSYNNYFAANQQQHSQILKNQLKSKQKKPQNTSRPVIMQQNPINKISSTNKLLNDLDVPPVSPFGSNNKSLRSSISTNYTQIPNYGSVNRKDTMSAVDKLLSPYCSGNISGGSDSILDSSGKKDCLILECLSGSKPYDPYDIPVANLNPHLNELKTGIQFDNFGGDVVEANSAEKVKIKQDFEDWMADFSDEMGKKKLANMILGILIDSEHPEKAKRKSIKMLVKTLIRNGGLNAKIVSPI